MAEPAPLVSIIIPHWKGREILLRCLESLRALEYQSKEVLLVDNGSMDGSMDVVADFPEVRILRSPVNLGYAGGCNLGLGEARGEFALLLNDDAVVTPPMLGLLVAVTNRSAGIVAAQPKILSIRNPELFDYAGAAGGEMDRYGFPFCRGRIFDTVEPDDGQYNKGTDICWASGACCLLRMSVLREVGFLDADFYAHMEEIDLQWRLRNQGYKVVSVPDAVVYHEAGSTLSADTPLKVYLNHRNSLVMLLKNYEPGSLVTVLPIRLFLDSAAALYRLFRLEPLNMLAVVRAYFHIVFHLPGILSKRRQIRALARQKAALYSGSIVWDYYVMRRRRFSDLRRGVHG